MKMDFVKKITSLLAAMVITVVTANATSSVKADDYLSESRTYYVYNAQTGNYIRSYTLSVPYQNNQVNELNSINSGRYVDNSKSGVVKLFNNNYYMGTGFVVSEHIIATAAHVFSANNSGGSSCNEIKFFDSNGSECASITGTDIVNYHIPAGALIPENGTTYDYALIYVNGYRENGVLKNLRSFKCFELGVMQESFVNSSYNNVTITGFPQEGGNYNNTYTNHFKLTGHGEIFDITGGSRILEHDITVFGGDSGCPLYTTETVFGTEFNIVIGITAGGATNYGTAVAINPEILRFYMSNSNLL